MVESFFVQLKLTSRMRFQCVLFLFFLAGCTNSTSDNKQSTPPLKPVYISPTIDKYGHFRKGHIKMPVSTNKNAYKNKRKSRYYYQTRGKYNRRKR